MPSYQPTHVPYGLSDPTKRKIYNPGLKDEAKFQKFGLETGGEYFYLRISVQPNGGVPLHRHANYGETFVPISGSLGVVGHNGTKTMILSPSTTPEQTESYTVQPGEWHRFFNPSSTSTIYFDGKVAPAHPGFEKMLYIFYGLVADGHGTKDGFPSSVFHQLMLADMGEMTQAGIGGWVAGRVCRIAGLLGRWTGEEERLTRLYYGRPMTEEEKEKWKIA